MTQVAPRRYHHGNLREELLTRAEAIVRERGVDELSLRELAREAGVSHAAPSRHFSDRRALLDALALKGFERLGDELAAAAARGRGGFESRLIRVATAYVQFAVRDAALLELMFDGKHQDGADAVREASERAFSTVLALIEEGQTTGALVAGDPTVPGTVLFATLQGLASLCAGGLLEGRTVQATVRETMQTLFAGLRPR